MATSRLILCNTLCSEGLHGAATQGYQVNELIILACSDKFKFANTSCNLCSEIVTVPQNSSAQPAPEVRDFKKVLGMHAFQHRGSFSYNVVAHDRIPLRDRLTSRFRSKVAETDSRNAIGPCSTKLINKRCRNKC